VVLEAAGLKVQLVNARSVKNVPGRAKTGKKDAVWLAKLTERGMLQPSFVPPYDIRRLRDYTRLRADLVHDRARHWARLEKLLERALIKVSSVASTLDTQSVRAMLEALIAGQRSPKILADLAIGKMRAKRKELAGALDGKFEAHHAELARMILDQIDALTAQIDQLSERAGELIAQIPAAWGVDADGTPGRLVSWAKRCPQTRQSGKKSTAGSPGKGDPWLNGPLGEIAAPASRTGTFLGERYRRLAKRRGKRKAQAAIARSILVIIFHLLADPAARFRDLGSGYYDERVSAERKIRSHLRQLEALGLTVTLTPAQDAA
jgi:hypothetical protein